MSNFVLAKATFASLCASACQRVNKLGAQNTSQIAVGTIVDTSPHNCVLTNLNSNYADVNATVEDDYSLRWSVQIVGAYLIPYKVLPSLDVAVDNAVIYYQAMKFSEYLSTLTGFSYAYYPIYGAGRLSTGNGSYASLAVKINKQLTSSGMADFEAETFDPHIYDDYYVVVGQKCYIGVGNNPRMPYDYVPTKNFKVPMCQARNAYNNEDFSISNSDIQVFAKVTPYTDFDARNQTYGVIRSHCSPINGFVFRDRDAFTAADPSVSATYVPSQNPYYTPVLLSAALIKGFVRGDVGRQIWTTLTESYVGVSLNCDPEPAGVAHLASCCLFKTKQEIENFFNDFGFPATDDIDLAQNGSFEDIGDWTPPGIPTTPPSLPSFPDNSSDKFELENPTITGASIGSHGAYTLSNTKLLLEWFRSNTFINDLDRLFSNPIDSVFALRLYPLDFYLHDTAHSITFTDTSILNVSTSIGGVTIEDGYNFMIDGGSYYYTAYYGNYADFVNVRYSIYIPFVGIVPIDGSRVVNKNLSIKYILDISSGKASAVLFSNTDIIGIYSATVGIDIPLTSSSLNEQLLNATLSGIANLISGNALGLIGSVTDMFNRRETISGNLSSSASLYLPNNAFLLIDNYYTIEPNNYQKVLGRPSMYGNTIGQYTDGFIQVLDGDFSQIQCTSTEMDELLSILKSGFYINDIL